MKKTGGSPELPAHRGSSPFETIARLHRPVKDRIHRATRSSFIIHRIRGRSTPRRGDPPVVALAVALTSSPTIALKMASEQAVFGF